MNDINSLSHSKWRCKYHIVFAPKYRRQTIYGDIRKDIGVILRKLCEQKKVEIIEAELCPDHIHMLVSIPPNLSVSQFVGYLKGKSSLMIFDRHANLKYKFGVEGRWESTLPCWGNCVKLSRSARFQLSIQGEFPKCSQHSRS